MFHAEDIQFDPTCFLKSHPYIKNRLSKAVKTDTIIIVMPNRANDWFIQAERNLEQANDSRSNGRHEWACFAAQQAAELAVKALHLSHGQEAWGHVVARLLQELPVRVDEDLIEKAKVLDNFYIPTRYPNGHVEGAPFHHYGKYQSEEAIQHAGKILEFIRDSLAQSGGG